MIAPIESFDFDIDYAELICLLGLGLKAFQCFSFFFFFFKFGKYRLCVMLCVGFLGG